MTFISWTELGSAPPSVLLFHPYPPAIGSSLHPFVKADPATTATSSSLPFPPSTLHYTCTDVHMAHTHYAHTSPQRSKQGVRCVRARVLFGKQSPAPFIINEA